jgi:hypothetical protein
VLLRETSGAVLVSLEYISFSWDGTPILLRPKNREKRSLVLGLLKSTACSGFEH